MGKFSAYKIPLKDLSAGTHVYEYDLDNDYFRDIEGPEVPKGKAHAIVEVKKNSQSFELKFDIKGVVQILCDRCLEEMDQEIDAQDKLMVKFGEDYGEEGDSLIIVPEEEGEINIAWYLYEFIALNIPIRHVHPIGKCSKVMVSKLRRHLAHDANEELDNDDDDELELDEVENNEDEQAEAPIDPRWEGLRQLLNNDNNN
ncbi:MAG: DUF177 domain-containing protein [Paludibacteraceae bacterium]|nr:DUF177 domain-containing protein [Paludibacteraceae bacterium]